MSSKPMRVVVRADAGLHQGSGHVVRCLTLALQLHERGHEVELAVTVDGIPWLDDLVERTGLPRLRTVPHLIDHDRLLARDPDWVVVDSYRIPADSISRLGRDVAVLAVVDGDLRGIEARLYLDQNLGAERRPHGIPLGSHMLAGAAYALVRSEIVNARRAEPWSWSGVPRVVAFMGGTDATGAIVEVSRRLANLGRDLVATVVATRAHLPAVKRELARIPCSTALEPSTRLAELLGEADIVISAAGTSAWEIATLGLPAVLLAVVDNQRAGLAEAVAEGIVLGVDLVDPGSGGFDALSEAVRRLIDDQALRRRLSERATGLFDGRGASRVVDEMEGAAFVSGADTNASLSD